MNFIKRVNGSWVDTPNYIHKTNTDTFTTLPADIYANSTTATVGLKGNTVQSGTPTPDSPIMPQGTGERTGNRFDADTWYGSYKQSDGTYIGTVNNFYTTHVTPFTVDDIGKTFTFAIVVRRTTSTNVRASAKINGTNIDGNNLSAAGTTKVTFTVSSVSDYLCLGYGGGGANQIILDNIMLNTGSTPQPHEPYGYKIPISSANTTTPVYLGEVESTRRIKKLVLTGEENVDYNNVDKTLQYIQCRYTLSYTGTSIPTNVISSHLETASAPSETARSEKIVMRANATDILFGLAFSTIGAETTDTNTAILSKAKSYLDAQYAAGTPVTVWYVLANEETGTVNEPLMKIGSYADSISGISIPTTAGANTLDVDTTVAPSEVTANYSGWHPVQNVHEYDYLLASNPLCGISTYKDELNLATGDCTRRIKKLVFDGTESGWTVTSVTGATRFSRYVGGITDKQGICSHYKWLAQTGGTDHYYSSTNYLFIFSETITTEDDFKSYLAQQYATGTPVIVWYVLATPTTETITVPTGLSGTEEGYLNQSGTPTPSNPIYPTANEVKVWT